MTTELCFPFDLTSQPAWPQVTPVYWASSDDGQLVCCQIAAETHDVKTFTFAAKGRRQFRFWPGQFLTFTFPLDDARIDRCYTISSPPTRPDRVSITVKRVPDGRVSNWLHDTLQPGMEVSAQGPFGLFSSFLKPSTRHLFLSGGSGITPLMSMARAYADLGGRGDIMFVHSARSPADIIFGDELKLISRQLAGFRFLPICETDTPLEPWTGYRGRLTAAVIQSMVPDLHSWSSYVCGPEPYMQSARDILAGLKFPMDRYHEESFSFTTPEAIETPSLTSDVYRVEFALSRKTVMCGVGQTILEAGRQAGLKLASSCTRGLCGTCKITLTSGKVDMNHAGGIRQREIDRGQILICCSKPLTDLVIDR
jgi:ferredoxin-NADP reductase